jgi:hypothetical protein
MTDICVRQKEEELVFKNGPEDINKSRRLFNQLLLGLAALPVVGKYLKLGRGAGKVANITINKTAGMPEFFEPLVNKSYK